MPINKVEYWIDLADYDLKTAQAMFDTKRFLYVGFMCHQVIEKSFKAYYSYATNKIPEKIHNLMKLAKQSGLMDLLSEEYKNFVDQLDPLNIEARYPAEKKNLLNFLTETKCREIIKMTEELYQWIKLQLSIK